VSPGLTIRLLGHRTIAIALVCLVGVALPIYGPVIAEEPGNDVKAYALVSASDQNSSTVLIFIENAGARNLVLLPDDIVEENVSYSWLARPDHGSGQPIAGSVGVINSHHKPASTHPVVLSPGSLIGRKVVFGKNDGLNSNLLSRASVSIYLTLRWRLETESVWSSTNLQATIQNIASSREARSENRSP